MGGFHRIFSNFQGGGGAKYRKLEISNFFFDFFNDNFPKYILEIYISLLTSVTDIGGKEMSATIGVTIIQGQSVVYSTAIIS